MTAHHRRPLTTTGAVGSGPTGGGRERGKKKRDKTQIMGENQKVFYYMYGESFWASMDTKNRLDDGTTHRRWRGGAGTAASEVATVGITWRTWPSTPGPWRRAARCCSSKSAQVRNEEGGERTVFSHGPSTHTRTCAISGTSGSSGLGSVSNEHIDSRTWPTHTRTKRVREQETASNMANTPSHTRTLEMVSAGDHWSLRMSRQMPPLLLMLQW